jgi:hypothetical protein
MLFFVNFNSKNFYPSQINKTMQIDTIYQAIKKWNNLIDSFKNGDEESKLQIITYLNQGTHFSVDENEISEWKQRLGSEDNQAIHAYVGIDNNILKFFLIDSKSDAATDFSYIVVKEFTRSPPGNPLNSQQELISEPPISSEAAIYRNFRFNMYGNAWLETQKENLFRVINIPFDDYTRMELTDNESCTSFFGLTNEGLEKNSIADYHIEIITVKDIGVNSISQTAENYSTPRPPFTANDLATNYQLLLKSDDYV